MLRQAQHDNARLTTQVRSKGRVCVSACAQCFDRHSMTTHEGSCVGRRSMLRRAQHDNARGSCAGLRPLLRQAQHDNARLTTQVRSKGRVCVSACAQCFDRLSMTTHEGSCVGRCSMLRGAQHDNLRCTQHDKPGMSSQAVYPGRCRKDWSQKRCHPELVEGSVC